MNRDQLTGDHETAIRLGLQGKQAQMWTAIPAIVQFVDLTKMTIVAQPAIQGVMNQPAGGFTYVDLPLLSDVPICFPSAGGFLLTLPIEAGDEVLIVISSRCIDSWWQNGGFENKPVETRMHDISDGFAIPGPRSQPNTVSGISSTNAQLRNDEGTVYLEITPAGIINLVAPAGVNITGNTIITGTLVAGALSVPSLAVAGALSAGAIAAASVVATGAIISGTTSLTTHHHGGVTTGAGSTGPALP